MLERQQKNQKLTKALATLSTHISFNGQQNMLDMNRVMETILPDLLNQLYDCCLKDMNTEKPNYPAIDLGDAENRIAVQITADGSKEKMVSTLEKYQKHGLDKKYDTLWFLIISNDHKVHFTRQGINIQVKTLSDIAKDICQLLPVKFAHIYTFCEQELRTYFQEQHVSALAPIFAPSRDPAPTITQFMRANGIDVTDGYTTASEADIRNDLIDLKTKLSSLNDDQRWFIYQVMNWSMEHENRPEFCMIPCAVIDSGKDRYGLDILRRTIDSLSSLGLAGFEEDSWRYDSNAYWLSHSKGRLEEFDYFAGLAEFLKNTGQAHHLKRLVVDCDFSIIN